MLIGIITGVIFGFIAAFLLLKPKLKEKIELDLVTKKNNEELYKEKIKLTEEIKDYSKQIELNRETINLYNSHISEQKTILDNLKDTIEEKCNSVEILFNNAKEECEKEYLTILKDSVKNYHKSVMKYQKEIKSYENLLNEYKEKQNAITENLKREEEKRTQENYYKINLHQNDLADILLLRDMSKQLQNKEVLNKVIWKSYFEKPTNDLIGRLIGDETITGIYKITNISENKSYIGQAVDIAARFKQHIKRGLGAETPLNNKLYPALAEYGVENFTFEIIEKCERKDLNKKEKFWIDYYNTKTYGYNVTGGGS